MNFKYCFCGLVLVLLLTVGCVEESSTESTYVVGYALWASLLTLVGGMIAVPAGILFRESRYGWGLIIVGFILVTVVTPTIFNTSMRVDKEGFQIRNGIFGFSASADIKFSQIQSAMITESQSYGRRGKRTRTYVTFSLKSEGEKKINVGNDVVEKGMFLVLERLDEIGVPVGDSR